MTTSIFERETSHSSNVLERERRRQRKHGLHTVAVAAAAALLCLSSTPQVVIASSRHIPHVSGTAAAIATSSKGRHSSSNDSNNRFRFFSPRTSSNTVPLEASSSSGSSLRLSPSPEEENESSTPPTRTVEKGPAYGREKAVEDETTRISTTSFFRLPSDTAHQQRAQQLDGQQSPSPFSFIRHQPPQQKKTNIVLTQAQIQKTFVVSLMGLAGFIEGFCIRRHGCFPNLMTGTILKVAEAVGNLNLSTTCLHASMVGCYVGGGFLFSQWKKATSANAATNKNKHEQKESSLLAISVLSGLFFLLSDLTSSNGLLSTAALKLPLLAVGFGIINAGTVDVGAGVTYAMTGHVTKIGQGLATGGLAKGSKDPSATSAKGVAVFFVAALAANLVCGLLEKSTANAWPLRVAQTVLQRLPVGTTVAVAYAWIFRWYVKTSAKVVSAASASEAAAAAKMS